MDNIVSSQNWSISNVKIQCDTNWWGFTLHLNEDATQLLEQIDKFADELVSALGSELEPIAGLIQAYLKARNIVIKAEDKGEGVKLVSPWAMPTLLIPLPEHKHINDSRLRWTAFNPETSSWCEENKMHDDYSADGPALAELQDKLYCVARGAGRDSHLWWMVFDGEWGTYRKIKDVFSANDPALAEFQGKLYCVARGAGGDSHLWWMTFDGHNWSKYQKIDYVYSEDGPGLVEFQGKLYCVARGAGDSNLWWMTFDGHNWSKYQKINDHVFAGDTPSLAVFQNKLYCVARGAGDSNLWWTTFDGNSWSQYQKFNNGIQSAKKPALTTYRHPRATRDQLLCMYRGVQT
ncbi:MAG: hypothetical protein WA919_27740 [Coleofasciculaceae cyanobacterium]